MQTTTLPFPSSDGESTVHVQVWMPEETPIAVLQIAHGMAEHGGRYEPLARFLCDHAVAVCAADHIGHGKTSASAEGLGQFGDVDGAAVMFNDLHSLRMAMQERLPGVPYFILGHSMGSFVLRQYLSEHGEGLAGALLSGTGDRPLCTVPGLLAAKILYRCKGPSYRSALLNWMAFGRYNRRIPDAGKGSNAWLSRDPEVVRAYDEDELCGFVFGVGAFIDSIRLIRSVNRAGWYRSVPKGLPLLVFAGEEDPVGQYGAGVRRVCKRLRAAGAGPVRCLLYSGGRHEMLNELNRDQVWQDVLDWILDMKNAVV